jgi:hypothetical protein
VRARRRPKEKRDPVIFRASTNREVAVGYDPKIANAQLPAVGGDQ